MFNALFSARGRMRRRDWWLWSVAVFVAYMISEVVMHRFFGTTAFKDDVAFQGAPSNGLHYWLLFLATIGQWPNICLLAKRWHDRNRSGWLAAIGPALSVPALVMQHFGGLIDGFAPRFVLGVAQTAFGFADIAFILWVLVDCGILDGTPGPNKYGPSPKGLGAQAEDVF